MSSPKNLEEAIQAAGGPVELLRNSKMGPNVYPVIPAEYSNWREEQMAWQQSCVLFTLSYHMTDLYVQGPGALKLLSDHAINTFKNFTVDKAKQYVPCNPDGYVIGDGILFHLEENLYNLVGRPSIHNWIEYQAAKGKYDVKLERDDRAVDRKGPPVRKVYRYQLQGPAAPQIMQKLLGGKPAPDVKFFNVNHVQIAGVDVSLLRHGMVGQPGWELIGPWADNDRVLEAVMEAGKDFGLKRAGGRTYSSNTLESGWIPSPIPAVYAGDALKPYRESLPANGYEAVASLGGSFYSKNITDYYFTPWDLGYGSMVKFDHDFAGRSALEKMAPGPHREKVTLVWNPGDAEHTFGTLFQKGKAAKYIDFPSAVYAMLPYDRVMKDGKTIGVSTWSGYSYNERAMLSLATLDPAFSKPGTEVTLVWGEGESKRPPVEPHQQVEVRVTVAPCPYSEVARTAYRPH